MTTSSGAHSINLAATADSLVLVTREQGKALLATVLSQIESAGEITLDLSGTEALSPSFADELFAGLDAALGSDFKRLVRINCVKTEWRRLISSALQHRRLKPRLPQGS
jgi:STAS-like domain of unknown function (DUF4325)